MRPTTHPPAPLQTLLATIGLHGSGSTWAFNIARELARYAGTIAELPLKADNPRRWRVLKSHHGSPDMDSWLEAAAARPLLPLRDPRDASLSMHQRFRLPLADAVRIVFNDCRRLHTLRTRPGHLLLRYESGLFRTPAAIHTIAARLAPPLDAPTAVSLAARYTPEATKAFAAALPTLPPDRLGDRGTSGTKFDRLTNIHDVHIGDLRTGKWRDLPPHLQTEITRIFQPWLEAFGYEAGLETVSR
jgi:hypothetical protein